MTWRNHFYLSISLLVALFVGLDTAVFDHVRAVSNPILHLSFEENTGCTTIDSESGHVFQLEDDCPSGGPTWVAGKQGRALNFDGNNDYIIDNNGAILLNGQTDLTVALWIKSDATGTDSGFITGHDPSTNPNDKVFGIRYDKKGSNGKEKNVIKATLNTTEDRMKIESSAQAQTTDWQHVTLVWDNGEPLKLFIDGQPDTPSYNTPAYTGTLTEASKLVIGRGIKDTGSKGWDGLVDEVLLYDTALTDQAVADLYQSYFPPDKKISPILECVQEKPNGRYAAFFGYMNRNSQTVTIPISGDNRFVPAPQDQGQPEVFLPGRHYASYCVGFEGSNLTWKLTSPNGQSSTTTASTNPAQSCSEVPFTCREDRDDDGLYDLTEYNLGSDPLTADSDGDGVLDQYEAPTCVYQDTCSPLDTDADSQPDLLDTDDDGDGLLSAAENNDPDGDGNPADALDSDLDGIPDYLDDTDDSGTYNLSGTDPGQAFQDDNGNPISSTDQSLYIWQDEHLNSYLEISDHLDTSGFTLGSNGQKSWFHFGTGQRSAVDHLLLIFPRLPDHIYARVCPDATQASEIYAGCPGEIRLTPSEPSTGGYTLINLSDPNHWYVQADDINTFSTGGEGVNDRLISHWRLDENTGTNPQDSISSNHGVIAGSPIWEPGVSQSALHFDGDDDRVVVPDDDSLDLTDKGSIQAWIRADTFTQFGGIVHKGDRRDFADEAYSLQFWNPNGTLRMFLFETSSDYIFAETTSPLQINQWYHVVATWDLNEIRLYLNGQLDDTITNTVGATRSTDGDLIIGAQLDERYNASWGHVGFDGMIDEVQLYNYTLSPAEIEQLYNSVNIEEDAVFPIIDDTYLDPAQSDANFGANDSLDISQDMPGLLRFDVSAIPPGSTIYSATLSLEALQDSGSGPVSLRSILPGNAGWIEGAQVGFPAVGNEPNWSYKYAASTTNWAGSAGLGSSGTDYETGTQSQLTGSVTTGQRYDWSLSPSLITSWINNPAANHGVVLRTDSPNLYSFASSEHPNSDTHPVLSIDYGYGSSCSILFSDNFDDADISDWEYTWDDGTNWNTLDLGSGNHVYQHLGGVYSQTQSTFAAPDDYVYTGEMTVRDMAIHGLLFRYQDDDNFWRLVFEFGRARIRGMVDGSWTNAAGSYSDVAFVPALDQTYQLKVQAQGDELRAKWWLDGESEPADWLVYAEDDRIMSGRIGVVNRSQAEYDNLQVTDCFDTNGLPPEIALDYPSGGETFYGSENETILWDSINTSGTLTLQYSSDDFSSDIVTVDGAIPDIGSYVWTVPELDGTYRLRLFDSASPGLVDTTGELTLTSDCRDSDGDSVCDTVETAIGTDPGSSDSDGDGVFDQYEIPGCVGVDSCTPTDTDGDGTNDALDTDDDDDGVPSADEDNDPNGDGDPADAVDLDNDGVPSYLDADEETDSDGDGIYDHLETELGSNPGNPDSDGDGVFDQFEAVDCVGVHSCVAQDTDSDGQPDLIDNDDDGDGITSDLELNDPNGDGDPADANDRDKDGIPTYLDSHFNPGGNVLGSGVGIEINYRGFSGGGSSGSANAQGGDYDTDKHSSDDDTKGLKYVEEEVETDTEPDQLPLEEKEDNSSNLPEPIEETDNKSQSETTDQPDEEPIEQSGNQDQLALAEPQIPDLPEQKDTTEPDDTDSDEGDYYYDAEGNRQKLPEPETEQEHNQQETDSLLPDTEETDAVREGLDQDQPGEGDQELPDESGEESPNQEQPIGDDQETKNQDQPGKEIEEKLALEQDETLNQVQSDDGGVQSDEDNQDESLALEQDETLNQEQETPNQVDETLNQVQSDDGGVQSDDGGVQSGEGGEKSLDQAQSDINAGAGETEPILSILFRWLMAVLGVGLVAIMISGLIILSQPSDSNHWF